MRKVIKSNRILLFIFLILLSVLAVGGRVMSPVHAATEESEAEELYTDVLSDLRIDPEFDSSKYAVNANDGSVNVIQIAESEAGELFIYTYQPSLRAVRSLANEINMSQTTDATGTKIYKLSFISASGVFAKYKVENFTVSKTNLRYYNISTIYRPYDSALDNGSTGFKSKACAVGQLWTVTTVNDVVSYSMEAVDVVTINYCTYGTVRVDAGFNLYNSKACDMHFIAFSTDITLDKVLSATVEYDVRTVDVGIYDHPDYGSWEHKTAEVSYTEKGTTVDHLFGPGPRTWDRISASSDFIDKLNELEVKPPENLVAKLQKSDWVLAFAETGYTYDRGSVFGWLSGIADLFGANNSHFSQVSNATIIRLEFIKDGQTYNLGVVNNRSSDFEKVAGDDKTMFDAIADKVGDIFDKVLGIFKKFTWWQWLLIVLGVIVGIVLVIAFIKFGAKSVFSVIANGIMALFKGLFWLISLPFKGIAALFKRKKDTDESSGEGATAPKTKKQTKRSKEK